MFTKRSHLLNTAAENNNNNNNSNGKCMQNHAQCMETVSRGDYQSKEVSC